jgi:hypothetical protein
VDNQLEPLIAAVERALTETESEYAQMPFFVRPMVRRGFVKRTSHDFARWRELLAAARRGPAPPSLVTALGALGEHYRGAPERARRGMGGGGTAAQLAAVEERSRVRAEAALALRAALAGS